MKDATPSEVYTEISALIAKNVLLHASASADYPISVLEVYKLFLCVHYQMRLLAGTQERGSATAGEKSALHELELWDDVNFKYLSDDRYYGEVRKELRRAVDKFKNYDAVENLMTEGSIRGLTSTFLSMTNVTWLSRACVEYLSYEPLRVDEWGIWEIDVNDNVMRAMRVCS